MTFQSEPQQKHVIKNNIFTVDGPRDYFLPCKTGTLLSFIHSTHDAILLVTQQSKAFRTKCPMDHFMGYLCVFCGIHGTDDLNNVIDENFVGI